MLIKLFDVKDGTLIPSEHCSSLVSLKAIKDAFPDKYLTVYLYIFYMTCWYPEDNPFFNMPEHEKEETIVKQLKIDFSLDDPSITAAIDFCNKLYDTPAKRAYQGAKAMMEKLAVYFTSTALSTGRDGNFDSSIRAMEKYDALCKSFKGIEKDYHEEIKNRTMGNRFRSYDQ